MDTTTTTDTHDTENETPHGQHEEEEEDQEEEEEEDTSGLTEDAVLTRKFTFIRHGEAEHNVAKKQGKSPTILDPKLTPRGIEQARSLGESLQRDKVHFDVVITSPLARAMQTTQLALGHLEAGGTKFVVTSLHTESGKSAIAQRGRSAAILCREFPRSWDYSAIHDSSAWAPSSSGTGGRAHGNCAGFMHPMPASRRLGRFRKLLFSMDRSVRVCVVGHSTTLKMLLGIGMKNCELVNAELASVKLTR